MITDNYNKPKLLQSGDTIGVCAPSGIFDQNLFKRGLKKIEDMGFNVYIPDEIFGKKRYMAGEDIVRAEVINNLFADKNIDAVICARGGYGAVRILNYINYKLIKENPKIFIGFSDITAVLTAVLERSGIEVVHGPVVTSLADASIPTLKSMYQIITNTAAYSNNINLIDLQSSSLKIRVLKNGAGSGILKGGNLATLCHLLGTPFQPHFDNSILFIEDVSEPPYKIDRMLTQMKLAGMFNNIKGLIIGSFTKCNNQNRDNETDFNKNNGDKYDNINKENLIIDEIILETFESLEIPIIAGFNAGHGDINISMRFGAAVKMDTDEKIIQYI